MTGAHRPPRATPAREGSAREAWAARIQHGGQPRHRAIGTAPPAPSRSTVLALRSIPVLGWAFLLLGVVRPFRSKPLRAIFWIDAFLSIVVHAAQIPVARREAARRGIGPGRTAVMTMVFGATWWKTLGEDER